MVMIKREMINLWYNFEFKYNTTTFINLFVVIKTLPH